MKVLFLGNDPAIFDAASAARARMRAYAAYAEELHILSPAGSSAKEEQDRNLFLHPVHAGRWRRTHVLARRARALIEQRGIQVVSAQDPFEHGLAGLRAIRGTAAKLHVQVHTDFLSPWFVRRGGPGSRSTRMALMNRYRRRIASRVLRQAHGLRVVSERIKAALLARYFPDIPPPSVIPVAVDATVPAPVPLPAHPFTFALVAVGRVEPEKRIEDILAALALIQGTYPTVGLFVIGSGRDLSRVESVARSLGLEDRVVFLGERPDARALMGSAQAFIQASAYEGYGRTLIEAALARVPIISTDVGVIGEVLKPKADALVAPVADPSALAACIVTYVEDNAMRHELAISAVATAHAHLAAVGNVPERFMTDLAHLARS